MGRVGRKLRVAVLGSVLFALGACAPLGGLDAPTTGTMLAPIGPPLSRFDIGGRASLRQGPRIDHFRFLWQHSTSADHLRINSPFGQGLAQIAHTAAGAELRLSDGRVTTAPSLDALANEVFGRPLPLSEIAEWLRGAYPDHEALSAGWHVRIEAVSEGLPQGETTSPTRLPRIIVFAEGDTLLRLVIDERN